MSTRAIYSFIFILIISLFGCEVAVFAQADTVTTDEDTSKTPDRKKHVAGRQLTIGADIFGPIINTAVSNRYSYEAELSYYAKNEFYIVGDIGWGGSKVDFADLKYTTTNTFARLGFNKSVLYRESTHDWDMMFMGLVAGVGNVHRGEASYTVADSVWGSLSGTSPGRDFVAVWVELTAGMRVELLRGVMAGWNLRGRFLMNGRSFNDLAPLNIAGYGQGDKNASFGLNLYLSYAIRWDRHKPLPDK